MDVGAHQKQAGLGQAAAGLVHGDGGHVGPGGHGGDGQLVAEIEVSAVGLIGQTQHPGVVGQLDDGPEIGTDAVIGGIVDQHGFGVGVAADGVGHLTGPHPQGDAQAAVTLGIDINGNRAAENQSAHDAAVDVAGQNDFVAPLDGGEHHALDGGGGAADH